MCADSKGHSKQLVLGYLFREVGVCVQVGVHYNLARAPLSKGTKRVTLAFFSCIERPWDYCSYVA